MNSLFYLTCNKDLNATEESIQYQEDVIPILRPRVDHQENLSREVQKFGALSDTIKLLC